LACFVLNFLKNCVVHSSSLSYLLCASFGPAGLILAASALISAFIFCIFVILSIDGGSLLFCIFLSEFSSSPSLMYSVDFPLLFCVFCFCYEVFICVFFERFPYEFSRISLSQLLKSFFSFVRILRTSLLVSCSYSMSVFILLFDVAFLLFGSPSCAASTITGTWSEFILFACSS